MIAWRLLILIALSFLLAINVLQHHEISGHLGRTHSGHFLDTPSGSTILASYQAVRVFSKGTHQLSRVPALRPEIRTAMKDAGSSYPDVVLPIVRWWFPTASLAAACSKGTVDDS